MRISLLSARTLLFLALLVSTLEAPAYAQSLCRTDPAAPALTIMPLGDSITEAEQGFSSYRYWLWHTLTANGCRVDFVGTRRGVSFGTRNSPPATPKFPNFDSQHEGRWDYTVDQVIPLIAGVYRKNSADVVLLHLGSNDLIRGQGVASTLAELGQLISILQRKNPDLLIFVSKIIPSKRRLPDIRAFNRSLPRSLNKLVPYPAQLRFVDQARRFSVRKDSYDGVHPNQRGEQKMAAAYARALLGE
jgi:acyl-CoA thioesterase-1